MKAHSMAMRERVVAACDAGTREQIAGRFSVSVSWTRNLPKRRLETGSIAPRPHSGGGHRPSRPPARGSGRRCGPKAARRWRSWPQPCIGP